MNSRLIIIIGIVVLVLMNQQQPGNDGGGGKPDSPKKPAQKLIDRLKKVAGIASENPEAAKKVAPFYTVAARLAEDEGVGTIVQMIDALDRAERMKFKQYPDLVGSLDGFGDARNEFFEDLVGKRAVALNSESRKDLSEACKAIAWVLENPNG